MKTIFANNPELNVHGAKPVSERVERFLPSLCLRVHQASDKWYGNATTTSWAPCEGLRKEWKHSHQIFGSLAATWSRLHRKQWQSLGKSVHSLGSLSILSGALQQMSREDRVEVYCRRLLNLATGKVTKLKGIAVQSRGKINQKTQGMAHWQAMNLSQFVHNVVRAYAATTSTHTVRFSSDEEGDYTIKGDEDALRNLVLIFLANSVNSSEAGRDVCVWVWKRSEGIVLEVEDEGFGVPISSTERMFLPFSPIDETNFTGTGNDLAMIQCIAQVHHANICVQGTPGCGTTFQIYFPKHQATET